MLHTIQTLTILKDYTPTREPALYSPLLVLDDYTVITTVKFALRPHLPSHPSCLNLIFSYLLYSDLFDFEWIEWRAGGWAHAPGWVGDARLSHLQSDVSVHGGCKLRKRANVGGLPAKGGQTVRNLGFDGSPPLHGVRDGTRPAGCDCGMAGQSQPSA